MNRYTTAGSEGSYAVPRVSGDEPLAQQETENVIDCSPRERG